MDIKERIKEVAQNGTLQSGEEIYYVETDDLYAILADIASEPNDIHNVIDRTICKECQKKAIVDMMRDAEENDMYDL